MANLLDYSSTVYFSGQSGRCGTSLSFLDVRDTFVGVCMEKLRNAHAVPDRAPMVAGYRKSGSGGFPPDGGFRWGRLLVEHEHGVHGDHGLPRHGERCDVDGLPDTDMEARKVRGSVFSILPTPSRLGILHYAPRQHRGDTFAHSGIRSVHRPVLVSPSLAEDPQRVRIGERKNTGR